MASRVKDTLLPDEKEAARTPGLLFPRPYPEGWSSDYWMWLLAPWAGMSNKFMLLSTVTVLASAYCATRFTLVLFVLLYAYHFVYMGPNSLVRVWNRIMLRLFRSDRAQSPFLVAIVGAGHGGIAMAIMLKERGFNCVILEKSSNFGGTWWDNVYPGSRCDVPAALYSFSFGWPILSPFKWATQGSLLKHARDLATHFGLGAPSVVRFNTEVVDAKFDEQRSVWVVRTKRTTGPVSPGTTDPASAAETETFECNVLVSAVGQLSVPSVPSCLDKFAGRKFHSARWPLDRDKQGLVDPLACIRNKRVAVVGAAASAIQIVPCIAPFCKSLTVFQRSPSYIVRKHDFVFSRLIQFAFRWFPFLFSMYRWYLYLNFELVWLMFKDKTSKSAARVTAMLQHETKENVAAARASAAGGPKSLPPDEVLIPTVQGGCKRTLTSDTWFQALALPHVQLIARPISQSEPDALNDADSKRYPIDVLISATGFKTTDFLCSLNVFGRQGLSLTQDIWGPDEKRNTDVLTGLKSPQAYFGICVPGCPNFFILGGPNTNLGHNSILLHLEAQTSYVAQACESIYNRPGSQMEVKQSVFKEYQREVDERMQKTVFSANCNSWYRTADGRLPNNSVYSTVYYIWKLFGLDESEFTFTTSSKE